MFIEMLNRMRIGAAGAFGAHPGHDAHLLSTLSAIQILIMQDAIERIDAQRVLNCALTRFLHCLVSGTIISS